MLLDNILSSDSIYEIIYDFVLRTEYHLCEQYNVHGANMGPTWVLWAPNGPHVGHMNLAIRNNTIPKLPNAGM